MKNSLLRLRNVFAVAFCLSITSILFASCEDNKTNDDGKIVGGFSYHNNYVNIAALSGDHDGNITHSNYSTWGISGGVFTVTDFDVTKGQDPNNNLAVGNVHYMDNDNDFCFVFGRHASKEVAATFNAACPPERNTFNHTAGELNF